MACLQQQQQQQDTPFDRPGLPIVLPRTVWPACPAIPAVGCVDLEVAIAQVARPQELRPSGYVIPPQVVYLKQVTPAGNKHM
jgi:hypothetical protein